MADFSNHRRFSLRCPSQDLIPVSIRLRSTIKTPKRHCIIRKAERALLNEGIQPINNTLNMLRMQRDTCKHQLEEMLDRESMEECEEFIKIKREARNLKTLNRQRNKIERLCHKNKDAKSGHSNIQNGKQGGKVNNNTNGRKKDDSANHLQVPSNTSTWVRNISSTPLTEVQKKLLSHGTNYAVVPKSPPITEYIATIEQACTALQQGKAEELRGEVKATIKKMQPPQVQSNKRRAEGTGRAEER